MNSSTRAGLVAAAGAGLVLSASPAVAGGGDRSEGGGRYVPVEDVIPDYYDAFPLAACGTTVTVESGDVREVEVRETVRGDGTTVRDYRGGLTLDLTRKDTGAKIDELDISGDAREVIAADGASAEVTLEAPSFLSPLPGEERFFAAEDLPVLTFVKRGEVTLEIEIDIETGATTSLEADVDGRIVDLCTWFDGKRRGDGDRDGHRDGHGRNHGHGDGHRDGHGHGRR